MFEMKIENFSSRTFQKVSLSHIRKEKALQHSQRARLADQVARVLFFLCAILLIAVIIGIFYFVGSKAFKTFQIGTSFKTFFTSSTWDPNLYDDNGNFIGKFGAFGLILGSIVITLGSILIVTPLAIFTAIFFTEVAPRWLVRILQPLIEIFTGIPSVVIGYLGILFIIPTIAKIVTPFAKSWGIFPATAGNGWGAAIVVLIIMVLPTTLSVAIDSLRAVPANVREASLALGSTRWQMMYHAVIPAAATGLGTAVVLGMARAIGETLAVSMVLNGGNIPKNLFTPGVFFQPNVNITMEIAQNYGEVAGGPGENGYWTLAFVLLVISFIFVSFSRYLASRSVYK
jgi:phosphate transport system permease protein